MDGEEGGGRGLSGAAGVEAKEFLRMVDKLYSELKCAICMELMEDAQTVGCGHWFCKSCALRALDVRQACPICKADATKRQLRGSEDVDMKKIVDEVRILVEIAAHYAPKTPGLPKRHVIHEQPVPAATRGPRKRVSKANTVPDELEKAPNVSRREDDEHIPNVELRQDLVPGVDLERADPIPHHAHLDCALCLTPLRRQNKLLGQPKGPFARGKETVMVHRRCALWSPEVFEDTHGELQNVEKTLNRCRKLACHYCKKPYAPLGCRRKSCKRAFHLHCVFRTAEAAGRTRIFWDDQSFSVFCSPAHTPADFFQNGRLAAVVEDTDPGRNDDVCNFCYETGTLLCCDNCPRAYHLQCHDPPLRSCPDGEWHCQACRRLSESPLQYPEEESQEDNPSPGREEKPPEHGDEEESHSEESENEDSETGFTGFQNILAHNKDVDQHEDRMLPIPSSLDSGRPSEMHEKPEGRTVTDGNVTPLAAPKPRNDQEPAARMMEGIGSPKGSVIDDLSSTPATPHRRSVKNEAQAGHGFPAEVDQKAVRTSIEIADGREVIVLEDEPCMKVPKTRSSPHGKRSRKRRVILDSGLSEEQRDTLKQVARRHGTQVVHVYTKNTTHVVVNTEGPQDKPKRTTKYCAGLAAGCPVMSFGWIWSSIDEWADEEAHETDHSKAMRSCATGPFEGQAFDIHLYRGRGKNPSRVELVKILELGGGSVTEYPVPGCITVRDVKDHNPLEQNTISSNQVLDRLTDGDG